MKRILLSLLCLYSVIVYGAEPKQFSIKVKDYSHSWTSTMVYSFSNGGMSVAEVDNLDENSVKALYFRDLNESHEDMIVKYLSVFMEMALKKEYVSSSAIGERNQKRINLSLEGKEKSIFVVNTYQLDIANFITFLNSFIPEKYWMKEFTAISDKEVGGYESAD